MPVSKKRKKGGKPVHRAGPAPAAAGTGPRSEAKPGAPLPRAGKPSNPFVAQQQAKRGALRGR